VSDDRRVAIAGLFSKNPQLAFQITPSAAALEKKLKKIIE
jgi:hypothetical protein